MNISSPSVWRIEVSPAGAEPKPQRPVPSSIYLCEAGWSRDQAQRAARELLADPVCETFRLDSSLETQLPTPTPHYYEVHLLPGVMDPVAASTELALADMKLPVASVRTARGYRFARQPAREELSRLFNPAIERLVEGSLGCAPAPHPPAYTFALRPVALGKLSDRELAQLSKNMHLFLDLREMQAVQAHYRALGREPTDIELETIAQTWSEHCVHKTLKASVDCQLPKGQESGVGHRKSGDRRIGGSGDLKMRSTGFSDHQITRSPDHQINKSAVHYDNLIKETIFAATQKLDRSWCLSVFKDNAGVIAFDEKWAVCFKVETHNRPSAIEPYGGAATGVGGVIRDILGTGLGAKPIANTDVFCFAPLTTPSDPSPSAPSPSSTQNSELKTQNSALPPGVLPPARVMAGVVSGVRDYGNRMGIPTVNGALYFELCYLANPLVFCGCVGLIPRDKIAKEVFPGDRIVVVGGRTGRDGIHGATFSSGEIQHDTAATFGSAVQIGNAITEKKMMDVLLKARDAGPGGASLYTAVTDCGAGGLSSAVGEMGSTIGAQVHLERVPLKYAGLRYDEIWISEAQERMVLSVPPQNVAQVIQLFAAEDVEATDIGQFGCSTGVPPITLLKTNTAANPSRPAEPANPAAPAIQLYYQDQLVADLDCNFLHDGVPKRHIQAVFQPAQSPSAPSAIKNQKLKIKNSPSVPSVPSVVKSDSSLREKLLAALSDPNIASKARIWRMYDHEVQGGTVVKPYANPSSFILSHSGPTDAAVLRPLASSNQGVVLSNGLCPQLSDYDPYWMAFAAVDEAIRNAVCVGADPDRLAILDNFCWGNCTKPDRMGALVRACQGCYDAALLYGTPFISGKDSLNNEYNAPDGANITIPGTLLISAIGVIADVRQCLTPALRPGDPLYLVGQPSSWPWESLAPGSVNPEVQSLAPGSVNPDAQGQAVSRKSISASAPHTSRASLPRFDPKLAAKTHRGLAELIQKRIIRAAHDVSDGGLLVAVAEMLFSSDCSVVFAGHTALTGQVPRDRLPKTFTPPAAPLSLEDACFTPWPGCYVVQVSDPVAFAQTAGQLGLPYIGLGTAAACGPGILPVNSCTHPATGEPPVPPEGPTLTVRSGLSETDFVAQWTVSELRATWEGKV